MGRAWWLVMLPLVGSCVGGGLVPPAPVSEVPQPVAPSAPVRREIRLEGAPRQGVVLRGDAPTGTRALFLDGRAIAVDGDGRFLVAFDRDAPASAELRALLADGTELRLPLSVAPAQWPIEHVNASITAGVPSAQFRVRRAAELERINAARATMTPGSSAGWRQDFVWPIAARISGRFGAQRIYRGTPGSYHSGVDLAAGTGTVYVAPADGVVILASEAPFTLEGKLLIIDHGMGLNSAFLHSSRLLVGEGDVVRRGQPIGEVGATGRATGPHLHWGVKWLDARIDPVTLVKGVKGHGSAD